ncbi:MAG: PSD1 domain-containing protein, partial [Verrucomicrobia bacterium]|nr:PSD1 domain-containing protein [Verrucomicrobiota bacterium]
GVCSPGFSRFGPPKGGTTYLPRAVHPTVSSVDHALRWTLPGVILAWFSCGVRMLAADDMGIEFFEKKIRPVLAEYCYECHSHTAKKLKADLYLDHREGLLQGGESGVAVVLGEPDKSRLIEAIRYTNSDLQMPPKKKLPEAVIADLVEWIKMGAPWPEEPKLQIADSNRENPEAEKRKRDHWAWQPIRDYTPPAVKNMDWPRSPIDHFILAKLEEKALKPAPQADRRMLIRRAYFDLTGLPPSLLAVEDFVADGSSDAFAKVVDQLLASPHYGERAARHWMDVARYGEDQAHSFQPRLYPQGFRYRDWLVRSLNSDMPYDDFIREQIAADLLEGPNPLERLPALGFFALGPVYYGDSKMFDQLDDRIDTLTRGFLGLTVACARCHDHKYDPISQKDYYALAGVFSSTAYVEVPVVPQEVVQVYDRAQAAIQSKNSEIDKVIQAEGAKLGQSMAGEIARYMVSAWKLENQRKNNPKLAAEQIAKPEGLHGVALERWTKYLVPDPKNEKPHLARWRQTLAQQDAKTDLSSDEKAVTEVRQAAEAFQNYVSALRKAKDALEESHSAALANAADGAKDQLVKPALEKSQSAVLDEIFGTDGVLTIPKNQVERLFAAETKTRLSQLRNELERLKKEAPPKYPVIHALKEGSKIANVPVLLRGNPETPGEEAPRRFLSILAGEREHAFKHGSGRAELADAIADRHNPLTVRVMVNRIWQHHFGRGLVRTASNFGTLGEPPTHPELLDYLASRFLDLGWSMKALHRMIMLSAAYQMSSQSDPRNSEIDPENAFLWRMNRQRLEVEVWRDAMLAVSDKLDRAIGGPSAQLASPDNHRRTLYAAVSRHDLNSLLRLFDFPDPNVTSDTRSVTTVPLQQLFVLNSEFMIRQAKALAAKLTAHPNETAEARVRRAFLIAYGRPPSDPELRLGLNFLSAPEPSQGSGSAGNGSSESNGAASHFSKWEQYAQILLSSNEFMYVD